MDLDVQVQNVEMELRLLVSKESHRSDETSGNNESITLLLEKSRKEISTLRDQQQMTDDMIIDLNMKFTDL